jgi:hypothetical protein
MNAERLGYLPPQSKQSGVTARNSNITQVSLPPQPIVNNSFSLQPLNEDGWFVLDRKDDTLLLVARGRVTDETQVITAFVKPMPDNVTDDGFFAFAKSVKKTGGAPERHEILQQEAWKDNSTGKDCVRVHTTLTDSAPQVTIKRPDPTMIIDSLHWVCKHPDGKKAVIVEYSNRFYAENKEADFAKKAETVFHGFEFVTH